MKKIKVITFNNTVNYGAVLQAVALQYYLMKSGFTPSLINYIRENESLNTSSTFSRLRSSIWNKVRNLLGAKIRYRKTLDFYKRNITVSSAYSSYQDFVDNYEEETYYIVGSDQVWNPNFIKNDRVYTLSFVLNYNHKISYASSFGLSSLPENFKPFFKTELANFNKISVREQQGKKILDNLFENKNIEVVLDPTLLLNKEDWKNLCNNNLLNKDKYILCYYMPGNNEVTNCIKLLSKKLSDKYGYKVVNIGKKEFTKFNLFENNIVTAGPDDFLNLFLNAEIVITNSFHGTAFAINFNKLFYSVIDNPKENQPTLSSRVTSLLKILDLENRIVNSMTLNNFNDIGIINYSNVNLKLEKYKQISEDFLHTSLQS